MKRKTAALYDPYLDVMGGGERHILSILQVLDAAGYDVTVFWDKDLTDDIKNRLNLTFTSLKFRPNIFLSSSPVDKLMKLTPYDAFFYVTDGSYFFSSAKKTYIFCMVPDPSLYRMNPVNKLKTFGTRFIANSRYTQGWLKKWGVNATVVYPYISDDLMQTNPDAPKKKTILSVGRFFPHLHSKKHEDMLQAFRLFHKKHPDFRLVIAGGAKKEDGDYVRHLEETAKGQNGVEMAVNVPYDELLKLYRESMFFWHFTGYGVDETKHPEAVEHLGMTPLEAMAAGLIPFCYRAGGPVEIIHDGDNGFLFTTVDELIHKTESLIDRPGQYRQMQERARLTVSGKFSRKVFRKKVQELIT